MRRWGWRDPRAALLDGEAWANAKDAVLTALSLPEDPDALLAGHARALDEAYREVGGRLAAEDTAVSVDDDGRLHVERLKAIPDPPSLIDLRCRVRAMLPRVDLPEVILEVNRGSWKHSPLPPAAESPPRHGPHVTGNIPFPARSPAPGDGPNWPHLRHAE